MLLVRYTSLEPDAIFPAGPRTPFLWHGPRDRGEDLARIEDDAKFAYENGATLLAFDTPRDIRAAIVFFVHVVKVDPHATTGWHAAALAGLQRARERLHDLAEVDRQRARKALGDGDFLEAESALHDVVMTDPNDADSRISLAKVRAALRLQAVELHRVSYPRLRIKGPTETGLGVPPASERITNDPRFSIIPSTNDRG